MSGLAEPPAAASAKAARKQQLEELLEERRLAKEAEDWDQFLLVWEEGLAELLRERRKRHKRLRKSLPEGSEDQVERWAKTFRKKVCRAFGLKAAPTSGRGVGVPGLYQLPWVGGPPGGQC